MKKIIDPDLTIDVARKLYKEGDKFWKNQLLKYFSKAELEVIPGTWVNINRGVGKKQYKGKLITPTIVIGCSNPYESRNGSIESVSEKLYNGKNKGEWVILNTDDLLKNYQRIKEVYDKYKTGTNRDNRISKYIWSFNKTSKTWSIFNVSSGEITENELLSDGNLASVTYFCVLDPKIHKITECIRKKKKKLEK